MKKPIPFGKYYLLERINVGGMAEVFRAKAFGVEGFERLVAVKRILPNIAEDKDFIRMFIDEAKIAVQLNHANIAQIFDLGMVEQHYYIALEHIHGRDLRAIYDRCRHKGEPMPIAQACFVTMKVCEGLDYAHNKRDQGGRELHLVHRDVSPQNMLVSFEGEVKIIDFGIAKAAGKGSKTQAGILKGKFGYMSPEQVRGLPIDRRSDVFSCGIVLYELLTGERLFYGESDFDTLEKVRNVEILPPTTYNRKIPDELERIVLKALAKDVEDRYQNAIDLHDELQAFVYTAGEFYSRKDLAGWMKSVFVKEIEEETAKLEAYRQIAAPDVRSEGDKRPTMPPPRRQTAIIGTAPPPLPGAPGGKKTMQGPAVKVEKTEELVWDEDELETSIYEEEERKRLAVAGSAVAVAASGAPVEPDLAALVTTARGWAAADHPLAAPGRLADGTDETSHAHAELAPTMDGRAAEPAHSREPSAIVRLEGLSRTGSAPALPMPHDAGFGNTFMGQPRRGISLGATIAIAATAITAVVVIVLFVVLGNRADDAPTADDGALAAAKPEVAPTAPVEAAPTPAVAPSEPAVALDPALQALTGFDLIVDPPGVLVKLDGRPIGKAPLQIRNLSPGEHAVEIEAPAGFFNKAQPVAVEAGKAGRVFIPLDAMDISASLTSEPADARYTLLADGQKVATGKTPDQVKLDPRRRYEVSFNRPGFLPETRSISIDPSGRVEILAVLTRSGSGERVAVTPPIDKPAVDKPVVDKPVVDKPVVDKPVVDEPAVAAGTGTLNLGSKPPCRIFIDGRDSGQKTPLIGFELDAGKHKITLVNNEFGIKETFSVTIEADKPTKVIKDLSDRMPGQ